MNAVVDWFRPFLTIGLSFGFLFFVVINIAAIQAGFRVRSQRALWPHRDGVRNPANPAFLIVLVVSAAFWRPAGVDTLSAVLMGGPAILLHVIARFWIERQYGRASP